MPVSAQTQAARLIKKSLSNLGKKLKAGKTLTAHESQLLQTISADEPVGRGKITVARNQVELATALGTSRQTISAWLAVDGNPGRSSNGSYNVDAWRQWAVEHSARVEGTEEEPNERQVSLQIQNERDRFKLVVLRKQFVSAREMEMLGGELGAAIRQIVCRLHLLAPTLDMQSTLEKTKTLQKMEDEILGKLSMLGDYFQNLKREAAELESSTAA